MKTALIVLALLILAVCAMTQQQQQTYPSNVCAAGQHIASYSEQVTHTVTIETPQGPQVADLDYCAGN